MKLGQLSLADVLDHYVNELQRLDEKPVLIGHALGELLTQLLLQRRVVAETDRGPVAV